MKKLFRFSLLVSMILSFSSTVLAVDFTGDANTELSGITEDIIIAVNELYGSELDHQITEADIDYGKAYKIYVDTNIFELPTNSVDEIRDVLENGTYIYLVPITIGTKTVVVNVQKGLPLSKDAEEILSEQEKQEVIANTGKWIASVFTLYPAGDGRINYDAFLKNMIGNIPDGTLLVGGLPFFQDVVAIIPNNKGEVESIVPFNSSYYNGQMINDMKTASGIYDYMKIKSYINDLPALNLELTGDHVVTSTASPITQYYVIGIFALVAVFLGAAFIIKARQRKE